ncbi:probable enoyl-CoA hydratase echA8 [Pieris napi]|uniref:probable enoyl-CoA hydratase echA8 n=1 Tax=Pieris napi TaxID=78633 RepID=UPI001FB9D43B|nr:probable enoyl-CoA hydratase echA8 [Pieris napi]
MRLLIKHIKTPTTLSFQLFNNFARNFSSNEKDEQIKTAAEEVRKNITVEKYSGITTLNIDRQTTRNSLDVETLKEMTQAIDAFDKDPEAKVLVFNGEGGSFCSGFDLDEIGEKGYSVLTDAAARLLRRPLCDKPTIAAVQGYAVAEGFELALACDLRIIEETAIMGCLGRRFGAPQSLFGGRRLTALIGLSRALDLLMTGRPISGADAYAMGLGCKLTATGTALGESIKLSKSLIKFPQNALIMDKLAAIMSQLNPNSEESMRDEAIMSSLLGSAIEDLNKGVQKFKGGVGKHGKFYKLTEMPLKDWELEESLEEIEVVVTDKKKKP